MSTFVRLAFAVGALGAAAASAQAQDYRFAQPKYSDGTQAISLQQRCQEDQLSNNAQAEARFQWAFNCHYIHPNYRQIFTQYFDVPTMQWRNLEKWKYPIFSTPAEPFTFFKSYNGSCNLPDGYIWLTNCESGCYAPDQEVRFAKGFLTLPDAYAQGEASIVTVAGDAGLDDLRFEEHKVGHYVASVTEADEQLVVLETKSGGKLKVTKNHPLVVASGEIKDAGKLVTGDQLVRETGEFDAIVSITTEDFHGKVWNVAPETHDATTNVIVAEGYLNGSHNYQSGAIRDLNRLTARETLPADLY